MWIEKKKNMMDTAHAARKSVRYMESNTGKGWKRRHKETEKQRNKNDREVGYKGSRKGAQQ